MTKAHSAIKLPWLTLLTLALVTLVASASLAKDAKPTDSGKKSPPRDEQSKDRIDDKKDHDKNQKDRDDDGKHCDDKNCTNKNHDHPKPPKPPKAHHTAPSAPTLLTAEAVSLFQINLTWKDNSTNELGFKIERSLDGKQFKQISQVLPNTTAYRDLNRFPDTKYFYRVRAFDAKGDSAYSKMTHAKTPAPECGLSVVSWGQGYGGWFVPTNLNHLVSVSAGNTFSTALRADGSVVIWSSYGTEASLEVTTGPSNVVAIATAAEHGLALRADGSVFGWGLNSYGQLDIPTGLTNVAAIASRANHNLALRADGTVVGWGIGLYGPIIVPTGLTGVVAISAGSEYSLALRSDGTVISWGASPSDPATRPETLRDVVAISAGDYVALALHADGNISSWTYLGQPALPPAPVLTNVAAIAAGNIWSFAVLGDGRLVNWSPPYWFTPPPTNLTGVVAISVADSPFLALTTSPATPNQLQPTVLAGGRVALDWAKVSPSADFVRIERTTNLSYNFPGFPGQPQSGTGTIWENLATIASDTTHFVDETVETNLTYWYRLSAVNSCGTSLPSETSGVTVSSPLYAPWVYATPFADKAILNFSSANTGSTNFTIERALDPDGAFMPWMVIATRPNRIGGATYTDTGLKLDTTYWYRVRESNGMGDSPYSQPSPVTINTTATPTGLAARIGTTNEIDLSWGIPWQGDQDGFKIERATDFDGIPMNWTQVARLTNSAWSVYSDPVTAVSGTLWYRIRAFNVLGDSPYSEAVSVTLAPPSMPTLSGYNFGTTAHLDWWDNYYLGTATQFRLERTTGANGFPDLWQEIARGENYYHSSGRYGSFDDLRLLPGETYRYRVRTWNWVGVSEYSSPISITILPPNPPSLSSARVGGSNYLTLNWWLPNPNVPTRVRIERAPDNNLSPGLWTEIASTTNNNQGYNYPATYNDSNVVARAAYWYRIRAQDGAGISDYSQALRVAADPPPPPWLTYGYSFADEARLGWYLPQRADGFKIERAPDVNGTPGNWNLLGTRPPTAGTPPNSFYNHYTNSGLAAGTYWYRVAAFNWTGDSDFSAPVSVTIQPPFLDGTLTAKIGDTQQVVLSLSWNLWHGNDFAGYEAEHAPDVNGNPGTWTFAARQFATNQTFFPGFFSPTFVITNIPANTTNWFRVRAFNALGYSDYVGPTAVRTVSPPPAPEKLTAQSLGNSVRVSWESSYDYGFVSKFDVERAKDAGGLPGGWTHLASVNGGEFSSNFYEDANLTASTKYWYRVRASNWLGESPFSDPVNTTVVLPQPPTISAARIGLSNRVVLQLSAGYPIQNVRGFNVERAPDSSGAPGVWTDIGSVYTAEWSSNANFTDTNVTANSTFWYRARVLGAVGISEPSQTVRVSAAPPAAPYFSVSAIANRVTLSIPTYLYSDYGSVAGFNIERAPDNNGNPGAWTRIATTSFLPTYNDTLPTTPGKYWYRIQAYNWIGNSEYSEVRIVTIRPPVPPRDVRALVSTTNWIKLYWYSAYPVEQDGFKVDRAPDVNGQPGAWLELAAFLDGGSYQHGFVDTNGVANSTNWYRIRAYNVVGESLPSTPVNVALVPPPTPSMGATVFANRASLFWSGDYARYGTVDGFELERAADSGGTPGSWSRLATIQGIASSYSDDGLPPGSRYWYRVRARNWLGASAYSDPVSATIVPPAGPYWVTALIGNTNQVRIKIGANYPYEQDGFELDRAAETNSLAGAWEILGRVAATNETEAAFVDTNALAFTTNWYRARAVNGAGVSTNSEALRIAIVPPPAPEYFTASTFANQSVITWSRCFPSYGQVQGFRLERASDNNGSPDVWTVIADMPTSVSSFPFPQPPSQCNLSYADTSLIPNATYWYRVQAYNWVGDGEYTFPQRVTITPPAPPQYLNAKVGETNNVELEWYPPARNDQAGYYVERAADLNGSPGVWQQIATITNYGGVILPWIHYPRYSDPGVTANTTLWYRVRSFNVVGISDYTTPVAIALAPPRPPISLRASVFVDRATLNWESNDYYNYGAISGFKIERARDTGSGPGTWSEIITTSNWTYTDTGLSGGKYWYRVKAYNWMGDSIPCDARAVTIVLPSSPRYLQAEVGTTNRVALLWLSDSPFDQDGFQLEIADDIGGAPGTWMPLATVSATNQQSGSYVQTNAMAYSTNWYRVRAFNRIGVSDFSDALPFVVAPPPVPTQLSASQFADRVNLFWYDYTSGDVSGFKVERALDLGGNPGAWTQIAQVRATNSFSGWWYAGHSDRGLSIGKYWYRIRAYNWVGESDSSTPTRIDIFGPRAPGNLYALIGQTNEVLLDWSEIRDASGYYLERSSDVGGVPGTWSQIATVLTTDSISEFTDTNLTWHTTNWYRVRSFNVLGVSSYSPVVESRLIPPPAPIVQDHGSRRKTAYVGFLFNGYGNGYGFINGFQIERATDSGGIPNNWTVIYDNPNVSSIVTYQNVEDTNLNAHATYWYRARAYNWLGRGEYSPELSIKIIPPATPTDFWTYVANTNRVDLFWYSSSRMDQDGYKLERSTNFLTTWTQIATIFATNYSYASFSDTNPVVNVTNYYRVRAFNIVGDSAYSTTASAFIQSPVASSLSALITLPAPRITQLTLTNHSVLLTWTATGGTTNVVEATAQPTGNFTPVSPNISLSGNGSVTTNYLDIGALTNSASRFYRIRVVQ